MPAELTFKDFVRHQLQELGLVEARAMFGGYGLYHDGVFFGIIHDDRLYFKTDDTTRPAYIARGMEGFEFRPDQKKPKTYYEVPGEVFDNPTELARWARQAVEVQKRAT